MKIYQPMAVLGFSFGGALLAASLIPFRFLPLLCGFAGAAFVISLLCCFRKGTRRRIFICGSLLLLFLGVGINMSQRYEWASLAEQMPESAVVVQGKIKAAYPSMGETRSYLLQTKLIGANGFPQHKNIIIYGTNDIDFHAGEWIQCDLIGFRNVPTRSQLGKGADMIGWVDFVQPQILKEASSFDKMMENLKFMLTVNLKQSVPAPYDTILIAMLLGDASEMDMTVYDRFNLTGISHVLCVSGLHITFIGGVIIALFQLIFGKRLIPDLMGLGAMIFFVVLTGSTAPAMRALVMTATMIFSKHIIRDYSPINTLGGVVFLFCAIDPAVVYNLGFLLSVLSIYAICAVAPKWMNALCRRFHVRNRFLKNGLSILCSSCAVSVFLMPIMMIFNGYTSLLAPLANLAILPIIPFSMILGAICAVIGGTSIGMFLGKVNGLLLHWIIEGVEKAGESSFALLPLNFPLVVIGMMVCFVILSLPSFGGRLRIYRKQAVGLSALVLMISIGITVQMNRQVLQITEIRTTEGESLVLSQDGQGVVVGCGGDSLIGRKTANYLRSVGIRSLSYMIIPSGKGMQAEGALALLKLIPAKVILTAGQSNYVPLPSDFPDANVKTLIHTNQKIFGDFLMQVRYQKKLATVFFTGREKEIVIENDGSFRVLQQRRILFSSDTQKGDTFSQKYDIISTGWVTGDKQNQVSFTFSKDKTKRYLSPKTVELFEKQTFEALNRGEHRIIRITKDGKMTVKEKM